MNLIKLFALYKEALSVYHGNSEELYSLKGFKTLSESIEAVLISSYEDISDSGNEHEKIEFLHLLKCFYNSSVSEDIKRSVSAHLVDLVNFYGGFEIISYEKWQESILRRIYARN